MPERKRFFSIDVFSYKTSICYPQAWSLWHMWYRTQFIHMYKHIGRHEYPYICTIIGAHLHLFQNPSRRLVREWRKEGRGQVHRHTDREGLSVTWQVYSLVSTLRTCNYLIVQRLGQGRRCKLWGAIIGEMGVPPLQRGSNKWLSFGDSKCNVDAANTALSSTIDIKDEVGWGGHLLRRVSRLLVRKQGEF